VVVLEPRGAAGVPRADMLPPAARPILARLGVADVLERSVALGPALSLWAGARPETLGHGMGLDAPSISLDRRELGWRLRARAVHCGVDIRALQTGRVAGRAGDWRVTARAAGRAESVRARFLIDATGRPAHLARRLGARLQLGPPLLARTHPLPAGPGPRLVIEATAHGWWYALPLPGGDGTLGFVSAPGAAVDRPTLVAAPAGPAAMGDGPEGDVAGARAGDGVGWQRWDARMARLTPVAGDGWLAAGDAATAFDPIAAQGLFNALSGGFFAGNAAMDALSGQGDALGVYANLVARTAWHSHHATPLHYASVPRATPFWQRQRQPLAASG
jgi:hypothetical protein